MVVAPSGKEVSVLIVDRDQADRRRLGQMLGELPDVSLAGLLGTLPAGDHAIAEDPPDLLLLDVSGNGETLAEFAAFERSGWSLPMVATSRSEEHALRAFELHALDYLLKPVSQECLLRGLDRFRAHRAAIEAQAVNERLLQKLRELPEQNSYLERLAVRTRRGGFTLVETHDIDWVDAAGNYLIVNIGGARHRLRETMTSLEAKLDPRRFVRVHRSTIVNINRIHEVLPRSVGDHVIVLKTGQRLNLGRSYRDRFARLLGQPQLSVKAHPRVGGVAAVGSA